MENNKGLRIINNVQELLIVINNHEGLSKFKYSRITNTDYTTIINRLRLLEEIKLIYFNRDTGRTMNVYLTDKGKGFVEHLNRAMRFI